MNKRFDAIDKRLEDRDEYQRFDVKQCKDAMSKPVGRDRQGFDATDKRLDA
jgi:hypothetical protein